MTLRDEIHPLGQAAAFDHQELWLQLMRAYDDPQVRLAMPGHVFNSDIVHTIFMARIGKIITDTLRRNAYFCKELPVEDRPGFVCDVLFRMLELDTCSGPDFISHQYHLAGIAAFNRRHQKGAQSLDAAFEQCVYEMHTWAHYQNVQNGSSAIRDCFRTPTTATDQTKGALYVEGVWWCATRALVRSLHCAADRTQRAESPGLVYTLLTSNSQVCDFGERFVRGPLFTYVWAILVGRQDTTRDIKVASICDELDATLRRPCRPRATGGRATRGSGRGAAKLSSSSCKGNSNTRMNWRNTRPAAAPDPLLRTTTTTAAAMAAAPGGGILSWRSPAEQAMTPSTALRREGSRTVNWRL